MQFYYEAIPMFYILNGQITFRNAFASQKPVCGVQSTITGRNKFECQVDEELFQIPSNYTEVKYVQNEADQTDGHLDHN